MVELAFALLTINYHKLYNIGVIYGALETTTC